MPGSGTKNSLSRYLANSAHTWDEAAIIAAAWLISGSSKRKKSVNPSQVRNPLLMVLGLTEILDEWESAIKRPEHKGYRPVAQEERKRTRQRRRHRNKAQNNIEVACEDAAAQLTPGGKFKGKSKRITKRGQRLACVVVAEDPSQPPVKDALEHWHGDHFDAAKVCAGARGHGPQREIQQPK